MYKKYLVKVYCRPWITPLMASRGCSKGKRARKSTSEPDAHARQLLADADLHERLLRGLGLIRSEGISVHAAAARSGVDRRTLAKYTLYTHEPRTLEVIKHGPHSFLSEDSLRVLEIAVHSLDNVGWQVSRATVKRFAAKLKKMELEQQSAVQAAQQKDRASTATDDDLSPFYPNKITLKKIIAATGAKEKLVHGGTAADTLKTTKCQSKYLNSLYDILEELYAKLQLDASHMYDVYIAILRMV
jgi:hypothetical protein